MARTLNRGQAAIVSPGRTAAQARGESAERLAEAHLALNRVVTLARNVRCRGGEADLVCLDAGTVVFVEVRLRTSTRFGGAAESITPRKQQRVILAARWWLAGAGHRYAGHNIRFDAILLDSLDATRIEWVRAAFDAQAW
ncbi:MAG TPA: YraN family protein [Rhodocyclaceae bacterium]|nr:YraN family protein [Rhodocyclaceae bacterium]